MNLMEDVQKEINMKDYHNYYGHPFYCHNCGKRNYRYIKRGKLLDTISFECDNCGCAIEGGKTIGR